MAQTGLEFKILVLRAGTVCLKKKNEQRMQRSKRSKENAYSKYTIFHPLIDVIVQYLIVSWKKPRLKKKNERENPTVKKEQLKGIIIY